MLFTLLGHDCPFGQYPAPVVPIGRLQGRLVAILPGETSPVVEDLPADCHFVHYDRLMRKKLRTFDYQSERLFAFSDQEVECYPAQEEKQFFQELLREPGAGLASRFMESVLPRLMTR
jgi:hypothetical protein